MMMMMMMMALLYINRVVRANDLCSMMISFLGAHKLDWGEHIHRLLFIECFAN